MSSKWRTAPLGDFISYLAKGIVPKYTDVSNPNAVYVIGQRCIRNQRLSLAPARLHDSAKKAVKPEKELRRNDILINATGVGSAGRVAQALEGPPAGATTDGHVLTLRPTNIDPIYLDYLLKSQQSAIETMAEGSTGQTEMNKDRLANEIIVPFPEDEDTQRSISRMLLNLDEKIDLNQRTNDYLAAICDAAFSEQFGNTDDNAVLSDIADIAMGQSPSGKSYNEEGKGTVFYQVRGEFGWRFPTQRLFTTEPKRMVAAGDVLMSVRAPVGDLNVAYEDCCIGRGLAAIHSQYPSFCLYLLRSLSRRLNAYNSEGTVFGSINGKTLKALKIALPDKKSIESFEAKADSIDVQINRNSRLDF